MIDLCCHLFEGTDDGGRGGFDERLEVCRLSLAEGVRAVVATLRWPAGATTPPGAFADFELSLARLQEESGGALRLRPGFVFEFGEGLPNLAEKYGSKLALGGGTHLLVSLPALKTPAGAEGVWDALAGLGFRTVIARPECSTSLRLNPERLDRWVAGGVVAQLDAASVVGAYGREARRFAWRCLRSYPSGRVVVASGQRRASLGRAAGEIAKKIGRRRALDLVERTPADILGEASGGDARARAYGFRRGWATLVRAVWASKTPA